MLVLLDHGTPRGIARALQGHTIKEAKAQGWDTLSNGDLLKAAEEAGFEALLTTDTNLPYQQNLEGRKLAVVILAASARRLETRTARRRSGADIPLNRVRERPEAKLMGLPDCGILALRYLAPGGGTHADYFSTIRHSEKRRRWRIHARGGRERLEIGEGAHHRAVSALSGAIRGRQPNYGKDCRQRDYCVELPAASRPERSRRALGCPWRRGGASGWWVRHVLAVI